MRFWKFRSRVPDAAVQLSKAAPPLTDAIDRFARDVAKAERRLGRARLVRVRRGIQAPPRPRRVAGTRPVGRRSALPRSLRTGTPATVLSRRHPPTALTGSVDALAAALRARLITLRRGLSRIPIRLGGRTR
jgi:hypothetical protein